MTGPRTIRSTALWTLIAGATAAALIAGCGASSKSPRAAAEPNSPADASTAGTTPEPSPIAGLGAFPQFPRESLPKRVAASLQAVLDEAVKQGTFRGVTAAVIDGDAGTWSGAAGVDLKLDPLTSDARLLTASVGKTVTAAQVLRLVDEGKIGLDDPAADHFPSEIASFDANGATIRDLLGMRSGITDPPGYIALVDSGLTPAELVKKVGKPLFPAGSEISYANINYILLGSIIEHVTGRAFSEVVRSGVLRRPGLDGLVYGEKSALAADGWRIESDPISLARWGHELYGGYVLSDDSLRQMTDFHGDFYGLGAIDFSHPDTAGGFDFPAIGHGGFEPFNGVMLVAFPEEGVVVAIQANVDSLAGMGAVAAALRDAAQP